MDGLGAALAAAFFRAMVFAFVAGMLTVIGLWAAWHYVFSRVDISWG